jgi:PTS system nitrogen regulatory IIA component
MDIGEWLERGAIVGHSAAANKKQALTALAELGAKAFGLDADKAAEALMEREAAGSTGVGYGVALPHARLKGLDRMRAAFLRLEAPVEFDAVDDQPVDLLFALFAPPHADSEHLRALAQISRRLRHGDLRGRLRKARTADAIHALLVQSAEPSVAKPSAA